MKKTLIATLAGLAISCSATLLAETKTAEGDATKGQTEAKAKCASCHGEDGNSTNPLWPKLAGQHASYIEKQLLDFQSKKRSDPMMSPMASLLDAQGVKDVAAYLSTQKSSAGTAAKEKVAAGKLIYKGGKLTEGVTACASCHSPTGMGNPASKYPRVSGQHAQYVVKQLQDFKLKTRNNDSGIMSSIAKKMTTADMEAVAEYMSGLH
jgi:cytochrome c553